LIINDIFDILTFEKEKEMKIKVLYNKIRCQNFVKNEKTAKLPDIEFDKNDIVENQIVAFSLSKPIFGRFHLLTPITSCNTALSIPMSFCQRKTNPNTSRRY